jgi:hypothetical protein
LAQQNIFDSSRRIKMAQNTCSVCNKSFNTEEELREHQRTAHGSAQGSGKKENERPGSGEQQPQHRKEDKIAS